MNIIAKLLTGAPPELIAAVIDLVRAVVESDDPARTARRQATMVAARTASRAAAKRALGGAR